MPGPFERLSRSSTASKIYDESKGSGAASRSTRSSTSDRNMATTALTGLLLRSGSTLSGLTSRMLSNSRPGRMSASPSNSPRGIISALRRLASREAPAGTSSDTRPRSMLHAVTIERRSSYLIVRKTAHLRVSYMFQRVFSG